MNIEEYIGTTHDIPTPDRVDGKHWYKWFRTMYDSTSVAVKVDGMRLDEIYGALATRQARETIGVELVNRQGKLTKRIRKFIRDSYNVKLPDEVVANIGNNLIRGFRKDASLNVLIGTRHDMMLMEAGDFNDRNACFFGEMRHNLLTMVVNKNYGVVQIEVNDTNVARCWYTWDGTGVYFFNFYGMSRDEFKMALSIVLEETPRQIGFDADGVWVNGDEALYFGDMTHDYYDMANDIWIQDEGECDCECEPSCMYPTTVEGVDEQYG